MPLLWYDTVLPPLTISGNQELALTLGAKTLVQLTGGTGAFQIFGLAQAGGNVAGAVITFANVSNGSATTYKFMGLSSSASSPVNRFRNPNGGGGNFDGIGPFYGSITYFYDSSVSLWIMLYHS